MAGTGASAETSAAPTQVPAVLGTYLYKPPPAKTVRVAVRNIAHPSLSRVIQIAGFEQKQWGGPSLVGRMSCESGLRWDASNGSHFGLLQFSSPTWASMWPGTPRQIRWITQRVRRAPTVLWTAFTDGTRKRQVVGHHRQRLTIVQRGSLPRNADYFNATAAIRVGQRAVSGAGPSTSWSCGL